jgi:GT2 family glycosyltransferase
MDALVITPVKDSLDTTRMTVEAVSQAQGKFEYVVFNDFSNSDTENYLEANREKSGFTLVHLRDHTVNPSPNYKLVLQMAQKMALQARVPLILIESDVVIRKETIQQLTDLAGELKNPGLIGVITLDREGNYNFPYAHVKKESGAVTETTRSLSFCCTLITAEFLRQYDFMELSSKKDWFDIHISRTSRRLNFRNYLVRENGVLHLPHSSRPWKQLKYSHPLKYYFYKFTHRIDRI